MDSATATVPIPLRIAHRGMPRLAVENTIASFRLALANGANGIELDVHATKDGTVVVHHDADLGGGTAIQESSFDELGGEMSDLPTLQSVCDLIRGRAELFVEIKGEGIEDQVERVLQGYRGSAAIHSFDHELVHRLSRRGTARRLGVLVEDASVPAVELMIRVGATDYWPHHTLVTPSLVEAVHGIGGRVIPWTVNDPTDIARLSALRVDGICTDDVRFLEQ